MESETLFLRRLEVYKIEIFISLAGGASIGGILSAVASGGVGGGVLLAIVGMIKKMMS